MEEDKLDSSCWWQGWVTQQGRDYLASVRLPRLQQLAFVSAVAGSRPPGWEVPVLIPACLTAPSPVELPNALTMAVGRSFPNALRWLCRTQSAFLSRELFVRLFTN